jgi:hypothetical protein
MAVSSPDDAGAKQHSQMIQRPASDTGRCNDSEPVDESLSRTSHQLKPDRYGLGCGADPYEVVRRTLWPVDVAGREATVKACGVAGAKPQGQSWAPPPWSGSR